MSNLITFDGFDNSQIRVTPDGRYSIYDVIRFCGCSGERKVWERLGERYPEVVTLCYNFKFSGKGQRETPVANREGILRIIGLLPGAAGQSYRESAAKVFIAFLDASPELAESIIDRATPSDLLRIEKRLRSKQIRVGFTTLLQDHGVTEGWQLGACTNAIYVPVLGGSANELKDRRGLSKRDNIRDNLSGVELAAIMLAEELALQKIKDGGIQGFKGCRDASENAGKLVKRVFE